MIARRLTETERVSLKLPPGEYFTVDPVVLALCDFPATPWVAATALPPALADLTGVLWSWRNVQYGRPWTSSARWN